MRINVDEGFLPHFAPAFREAYGADSVFVRAASDLLTLAAAAAMKARGLLVSGETIALFAPEQAEETLRALAVAVDGSRALFREACGKAPVGTFPELVDSSFGEGCFLAWLKEFEGQRYEAASKVLGVSV